MFAGDVYDICRCARCGLGRTLGRLDPARRRAWHAPHGDGDAGGRFRSLVEPLARLLRQRRVEAVLHLRREPGRILDVGCGRGVMLAALAERGWQVLGTELDERIAASARRALGGRVKVGAFEALRFGSERFDVIAFWHVLEHVTDPLAALRRARALLSPGGALLVEVPNRASWQARLSGAAWLHLDVPRHRWHFAPSTLARVAARSGLELCEIRHFSAEYGPFGALQSALARAGFGHSLFTRVLRPGRAGPLWREPALWRHLAAGGLIVPLAALSFPFEALAAAWHAGGSIRATLRRTATAGR
jgi:2-polyprenyl-3-methyl-5-hydroxy-6-metoxy-1,4-benzoquinol methylase